MNPEQWLSLKWNGGSTMSDRWLNQSKIIHFSLLMEDPQISNALKQVDLKKGKSQAYDYVKKMQSYAKELYNKNYR